jgi:hypothetical protein
MIISFYIDKNLNNKTDLSEVAFSTFWSFNSNE